ncbi:MAG: translational GTPase TypA [Pseudomonadota bacterium]|nr:translational GTPase TypA [Pseudomonadota bacterium]
MNVRNVAIIAHVDHGKTTLVDRLLQQTVIPERVELMERALDSNELERERGITILAKTTAVEHRDYRINIVDTPGHADFGGEVERILSMVDSVLLVVDAVEGPMPQTRFVTMKAFAARLNPILVINKIDRPGAAPDRVVDDVFDLFDRLGASERQLDFPVVFTSATEGIAGREHDNLGTDMTPLLDMLIENVPAPPINAGPFQMQISTLDYSSYVGVIGIGRVRRGSALPGTRVTVIDSDGAQRSAKISSIQANRGLDRIDLLSADAGDIVCITGIDNVGVSDTLCDPAVVEAMPALVVDEPTLTMTFRVNNSPFAGQDGAYLTSRQIRERLHREASHNVALRVSDTEDPDQFRVSGRGELHLSVLIETMRREGYELAVSRPTVITRQESGITLEPWEAVSIDVDDVHQGKVMESLGERKGELLDIVNEGGERVRLSYRVATRALMGFRSEFTSMTSGTGVMTCAAAGYYPALAGLSTGRSNGVLVSNMEGRSVGYALFNLQNRGRLIIGSGINVYEGMVIGIHSRSGDLTVNPTKEKKLTNIRAAGSDENILLTPPITHSLEQALEFINDDELVEITPAAIRIRKERLTVADRRRHGSNRDRS